MVRAYRRQELKTEVVTWTEKFGPGKGTVHFFVGESLPLDRPFESKDGDVWANILRDVPHGVGWEVRRAKETDVGSDILYSGVENTYREALRKAREAFKKTGAK